MNELSFTASGVLAFQTTCRSVSLTQPYRTLRTSTVAALHLSQDGNALVLRLFSDIAMLAASKEWIVAALRLHALSTKQLIEAKGGKGA